MLGTGSKKEKTDMIQRTNMVLFGGLFLKILIPSPNKLILINVVMRLPGDMLVIQMSRPGSTTSKMSAKVARLSSLVMSVATTPVSIAIATITWSIQTE